MLLDNFLPVFLAYLMALCAIFITFVSIYVYNKIPADCEGQSIRHNSRVLIITSVATTTILIMWILCDTFCKNRARSITRRTRKISNFYDIGIQLLSMITSIIMIVSMSSIQNSISESCKSGASTEDKKCCIKEDSTTTWLITSARFASIIIACLSGYFLMRVMSRKTKQVIKRARDEDIRQAQEDLARNKEDHEEELARLDRVHKTEMARQKLALEKQEKQLEHQRQKKERELLLEQQKLELESKKRVQKALVKKQEAELKQAKQEKQSKRGRKRAELQQLEKQAKEKLAKKKKETEDKRTQEKIKKLQKALSVDDKKELEQALGNEERQRGWGGMGGMWGGFDESDED